MAVIDELASQWGAMVSAGPRVRDNAGQSMSDTPLSEAVTTAGPPIKDPGLSSVTAMSTTKLEKAAEPRSLASSPVHACDIDVMHI